MPPLHRLLLQRSTAIGVAGRHRDVAARGVARRSMASAPAPRRREGGPSTVPDAPPPTLDLSAVLAPGPYVKRRNGLRGGADAARRLVDGRRELMRRIRLEIEPAVLGEGGRRRVFSVAGHGVPDGLLAGLADAARGWLARDAAPCGGGGPAAKLLFASRPDAVLLDQGQILTIDDGGCARSLASLPGEWEHDFEMYMVVMDRMGSRLASLAAASTGVGGLPQGGPGSGLVLTPYALKRWDATAMRGNALPPSLSPARRPRGEGREKNLTLEWEINSENCWTVVLRLQDEGPACDAAKEESCSAPGWDPISLVFKGEYVAP